MNDRPIGHLFNFEIAGRRSYGIAFESEADRDLFLAIRGALVVDQPLLDVAAADSELPISRRGRPSAADAILAARSSIPRSEFAGCTLRAAAELVRAKVVEMFGPMDGISIRTIQRHLKRAAEDNIRDKNPADVV